MAKNIQTSSTSTSERIGGWAFIIGALIAVILGVLPSTTSQPWVIGLLLALGVVVGLLNISDKEIVAFLVACVAFLVAAPVFAIAVGSVVSGFGWLGQILGHLSIFVLPAALIASIKAIVALAASR